MLCRVSIKSSSGAPLSARLVVHSKEERWELTNGGDGTASIVVEMHQQPAGLWVVPLNAGHWSVVRYPLRSIVSVTCPRLPDGPDGWWQELMNLPHSATAGAGVRIGVVDSAFAPRGLAGRVAYLGGSRPSDQLSLDPLSHGAQVCSVLIGHPTKPNGYGGLARGAEVLHLPAGGADGVPRPGVVAEAIRRLAEDHGVDLINLSLGDRHDPSPAIRKALIDANAAGALVLAAAGNNSGAAKYPAAYPECVSVGAIGHLEAAPAESISHMEVAHLDGEVTADGLYVCPFSPRSGVDAVAPGSGIVFDVNGLGPFDLIGTSFACPVATAALAVVLGNDPRYLALGRNESRSEYARTAFGNICRSLDLPQELQGWGVPVVPVS